MLHPLNYVFWITPVLCCGFDYTVVLFLACGAAILVRLSVMPTRPCQKARGQQLENFSITPQFISKSTLQVTQPPWQQNAVACARTAQLRVWTRSTPCCMQDRVCHTT